MLALDDPIAIVGGGASGLVSIKALQSEGFTNIALFERRQDLGGVWLFDGDETSTPDGERFPSPMYDRLVGNIWYRLLELESHKFPDGTPEFPDRRQMQQYLLDYANEVRPLTHTHTNVVSASKEGDEWIVQLQDTRDRGRSDTETADNDASQRKVTERRFKALILACGLYDNPDTPNIPGLAELERQYPDVVTHSKWYRDPTEFAGKRLLVVGNGPSGIDIAAQAADYAQTPIYRPIHGPAEHACLPDDRIIDTKPVDHFDPATRTAVLTDGTRIDDIDRIIISTGYRHNFPFLSSLNSSAEPLITDGARVHNLYKHIFYRPDPTLAFVGLLIAAIPFPVSEAQALTLARVWSGRLVLPGNAAMRADEEERLVVWGDTYKFHKMRYPQDADYGDDLRAWCEEASPKKAQEKLPVKWTDERRLWRRQNLEMKMNQLRKAREQHKHAFE
ncbi:monooxygenase [Savitreella phatthalungensis]